MYETKTDNLTEAFIAGLTDPQSLVADSQPMDESLVPEEGICFYIVRLAQAIVVQTTDNNFFIGRTADKTPTKPMLNLENPDGLTLPSSVSRRHAMIYRLEDGYEIVDLFSRNGTWVGGLRLIPNKGYRLTSGDVLRVGQERLIVFFK